MRQVLQKITPGYKFRLIICGLVFLSFFNSSPQAYARLGIVLEAEHNPYVLYERIKLDVKVANYTGNRIDFSAAEQPQNHLTFSISRDGGRSYQRVDQSMLLNNLVLRSGETKQIELFASDMYDFQETGDYHIKAQIGHTRLENDYQSSALKLSVRDGITLWEMNFGVPSKNSEERIPSRQLKLMQVRQKDDEIYCLRIEDDKYVYAVLRLGKVIQGERPRCNIDAISNIHILLRLEARLYAYRVYDYEGNELQAQYFIVTTSKPQLYRDPEDGTVSIVGGQLAVQGRDYIMTEDGASPAGSLPGGMRPSPDTAMP